MNEDFKHLLKRAGLSKTELAERLGLHRSTVAAWGEAPPQYAIAYIDLLIAYHEDHYQAQQEAES